MPDAPLLHYDTVVARSAPADGPDRCVVMLHGIYGHGRNWASVARRLVRERPEWGVVLPDLREHGDSRGFEAPHTVEAAARDVLRTADAAAWSVGGVLGHSFGGKVALEYARLADPRRDGDPSSPGSDGGDPFPGRLWVVDSHPGEEEPRGGAWSMIATLRHHAGPFRSREEGVHVLEEEGLDAPTARWMAMNLEEGADGAWRWRIDPDVVEALMRDFFDRDLWEVVESPPDGLIVHLVRATESTALVGDPLDRARAATRACERVLLHEVAGHHWLNADNPDALVELLTKGLP